MNFVTWMCCIDVRNRSELDTKEQRTRHKSGRYPFTPGFADTKVQVLRQKLLVPEYIGRIPPCPAKPSATPSTDWKLRARKWAQTIMANFSIWSVSANWPLQYPPTYDGVLAYLEYLAVPNGPFVNRQLHQLILRATTPFHRNSALIRPLTLFQYRTADKWTNAEIQQHISVKKQQHLDENLPSANLPDNFGPTESERYNAARSRLKIQIYSLQNNVYKPALESITRNAIVCPGPVSSYIYDNDIRPLPIRVKEAANIKIPTIAYPSNPDGPDLLPPASPLPIIPPSTLNEGQRRCFITIISAFTMAHRGIFAINGGPGTGKTHLSKLIYTELKQRLPDCSILCGAMTGSVWFIL